MNKLFISGHRGMVGSALVRQADALGIETLKATRDELDLTSQPAVFDFLKRNAPDTVIIPCRKTAF